MPNNSLFERCRVNTNIENDVFVGIQKNEGLYEINFPLGYHLSNDEKEVRRDILVLINTLARYSEKKESEIYSNGVIDQMTDVPVQAFLYIIKDYFERGYYKETETHYQTAKRGKINWSKTIKTQKPIIQEDEVYYLDYVVKRNNINEDKLITLVHEYCVWESFDKFGWLFTAYVPPKPKNGLTSRMMISVVNNKLQNTFNDRNRQLFKNMLSVLKSVDKDSKTEFKYGTTRFEYVWEKMIDRIFGVHYKEYFFPKTTWNFNEGESHENAFLEPDTIMLHNEKIYVLDAKYYKFGWSGIPAHLPESTSINKQITYGEYIAESEKFIKNGKHPTVFNAFLMPYDSKGKKFPTDEPIHYIGIATSDWKDGKKTYENVIGLLLDVKYFMQLDSRLDESEIIRVVEIIEKNISEKEG